jgi:hypothetical protein
MLFVIYKKEALFKLIGLMKYLVKQIITIKSLARIRASMVVVSCSKTIIDRNTEISHGLPSLSTMNEVLLSLFIIVYLHSSCFCNHFINALVMYWFWRVFNLRYLEQIVIILLRLNDEIMYIPNLKWRNKYSALSSFILSKNGKRLSHSLLFILSTNSTHVFQVIILQQIQSVSGIQNNTNNITIISEKIYCH